MDRQFTTLYRFTLAIVERLMEDVAEDQMAHQPSAGVNPPGWIVGHLAVVNDMALGLLGKELRLPAEKRESWNAEFGPGSDPLPLNGSYPPKDELMAALRDTYAAVGDAIEGVDLAAMTDPNPIAPLAKGLPTTGDLLAHILTTHPAMHIGHLSNWRRQMGFPPLF